MTVPLPLRAALIGGAIAAWTPALAQADLDFEAALKKAAPQPSATGSGTAAGTFLRPRPAGRADRYIGHTPGEPRLAPRGTIPAKWRGLTAITEPVWLELNDDIAAGLLDGLALLERVTQPLPLPPGALLVECNRQSMQFDFTMNMDLSADLSRRLALARQTSTYDLQEEAEREARPMIDTLTDFFLAQGFRPFRSGIVPSTSFYDEKTKLRVDIMNTSVDDVDSSCARYGMKVPDGPFLRFSNDPLAAGENFIPVGDARKFYRDRQKAKQGKINPFG